MGQQRLVKRRNQRCALPAKRHVAAAEIPHDANTGAGSDNIIVTNLHRMRRIALRLMPDRLPMAADSDDILRLEMLLGHQCDNGIGK